jgi:hypothetical protein
VRGKKDAFGGTDTAETAIQEGHTQWLEKFIAAFRPQLEPAFSFGRFRCLAFTERCSLATPSHRE